MTAVIPWGPGHRPPAALAAVLAACPLVADVVLVADGHAGHGTPTGEKLRLLTTGPRPRGPAHARNLGSARAATPLLLFVDADVLLPPRWLTAAADLLASHPAGHVCGVVGVYAPGAGAGRLAVYKNAWLRYGYTRAPTTQGGLLSSALLLRREDFLAVGGFDESFTRPGVEDTALGRALLNRGQVAAVLASPGVGHDKSLTPWGFLRLTFARAKGLAALPPPNPAAVAPTPPSSGHSIAVDFTSHPGHQRLPLQRKTAPGFLSGLAFSSLKTAKRRRTVMATPKQDFGKPAHQKTGLFGDFPASHAWRRKRPSVASGHGRHQAASLELTGMPGHSLPPFLWPAMATTCLGWLAAAALALWPGGWRLAWLPPLAAALAVASLAKDFFVALREDFGPTAPAWGAAIMMLEMPVAVLGGMAGLCLRLAGGGARRA